MAGELEPVVLIPRYATYSGAAVYTTIGMDVTAYQTAIVNLWRTAALGDSGFVRFYFEESTDQNAWTACAGPSQPVTPTAETETQYSWTLTKRWFRMRWVMEHANNVMTCYAVGFLEERQS